jgi:(1->4)-alpha-D-glucan 1-alpha-D-glucosylmutase
MNPVPTATYRLQLNPAFTFADAEKILDYLVALGISHVYLSPILTSRKGSTHGYDVTDPTQVDPELGGEEGLEHLQKELHARGLGLILDVVPNHMAACSENRWWTDVLEHGPASPYASYFDVTWHRPHGTDGKVMLPFLGETFGEALDTGLLELSFVGSQLSICYRGQNFPLSPASYADVLGRNPDALKSLVATDSSEFLEFQGILAAARAIRAGASNSASAMRANFHALRGRLHKLASDSPSICSFIEKNVAELNGRRGEVSSVSSLERLLASQHYSLAHWRTSGDEINYRRFFSIDDLVGVRVEDPEVFDATHAVLIRLCSHQPSLGFRIDHIDGLFDPLAYLQRLAATCGTKNGPAYLIVEKILNQHEHLPSEWPVNGTTGYDFLNACQRVFIDDTNHGKIERLYSEWTGQRGSFPEVAYQKKLFVMRELFGVEMRSLGRELANLARDDRYSREIDSASLCDALIEVTACLPQYRTYVRSVDVAPDDRAAMLQAIEEARRRNPLLKDRVFAFVREVLLLEPAAHVRPEQREARLAFVMRWQQFTGPITAKGLEDTALYNYVPLAALNEVGGSPVLEKAGPKAFEKFLDERAHNWPNAMNASTTHDTKRSEDVRARIAVLSEIPDDWSDGLRRWSLQNEKWIETVNGERTPDKNEEYFLYQTLIGTWPTDIRMWDKWVARLQEYAVKASREAKVHTRWVKPNVEREAALKKFVASILDRSTNAEFITDFARFQRVTTEYGMINGLSQLLLKIACPGVPDFYQGSEAWDFRLVDPDNRSPVCFSALETLLGHTGIDSSKGSATDLESLLNRWQDGRVKLHVIRAALQFRARNPDLFSRGTCEFVTAYGSHADRVLVIRRTHAGHEIVVVVPRCVASRKMPFDQRGRRAFWRNTQVEVGGTARQWTRILEPGAAPVLPIDGTISLGDVFENFPVALLSSNP